MKNIALLRTLLLIIVTVVGNMNAWSATKTLTITITSTGISSTSYDSGTERTWNQEGVSLGGKAILRATGSNAGTIQFQSGNGVIYNTAALSGSITSISITQSGSANFNCYAGNSSRLVNNTSANYTVTGGTQIGSTSTTGWPSANFSGTNYSYFAIKASATAYCSQIVITYEEPTDPTLSVSPESLDFDEVFLGETSDAQTLSISGTNLTGDISYVKGGADAGAFTIDGVNFTATTGGMLDVTFSPTEERTYTASITISSPGATDQVIDLTGTGKAPVLPYTVTFDAGTGSCATSSLTETSGGSGVTLPTATPPADCATNGWIFAGWAETAVTETTTVPTLYNAEETYYPIENGILYAIYKLGTDGYTLINNVTNLESGKRYLIVSGTSGDVNVMVSRGSSTTANNQGATIETVSSNQIILNSESTATPFILGTNTNNDWTFSDGTYYLTATNTTNNNYLRTTTSLDNYSGFSIVFNSDIAVITCTGKTSRNIMKYNSSSDLFSCYTSGQNDIYLYKENTSTYNSNPDCTPDIIIDPTSLELSVGEVAVNSSSSVQTLTISGINLTDDISYTKGTETDANAFDITETSWDAATGGVLSITFNPTEVKTYTATLTISSSGAADKIITLTGTGTIPTGIDNTDISSENQLSVTSTDNNIRIQNLQTGSVVKVYDIAGKIIADKVINGSETVLPVNSKGLYFVKVIYRGNTQMLKVINQ